MSEIEGGGAVCLQNQGKIILESTVLDKTRGKHYEHLLYSRLLIHVRLLYPEITLIFYSQEMGPRRSEIT